jgi:hypothetical protein
MDLLLISNLMVAGGTIALAYFTYKVLNHQKNNLNFYASKHKFLTLNKNLTFVQDKEFKGNKIGLYLSNHSEGQLMR